MTEKKKIRKPRFYTDEFKQQLALLHQNGFAGNTILPLLCLINGSNKLKHLVLSMKKIIVQKNSRNSRSFVNGTASWRWRTTFMLRTLHISDTEYLWAFAFITFTFVLKSALLVLPEALIITNQSKNLMRIALNRKSGKYSTEPKQLWRP